MPLFTTLLRTALILAIALYSSTLLGCSAGTARLEGQCQIQAKGDAGEALVLSLQTHAEDQVSGSVIERLQLELDPGELRYGSRDLILKSGRYEVEEGDLIYRSENLSGTLSFYGIDDIQVGGRLQLWTESPSVDLRGIGNLARDFRFTASREP